MKRNSERQEMITIWFFAFLVVALVVLGFTSCMENARDHEAYSSPSSYGTPTSSESMSGEPYHPPGTTDADVYTAEENAAFATLRETCRNANGGVDTPETLRCYEGMRLDYLDQEEKERNKAAAH